MKISVLGCGRWGSFIAWYLSNQKHDVLMWGRKNSPSYKKLLDNGFNEYVKLNENIFLCDDLEKAINHAEVIIVSISSQSLRNFMADVVKCDIKDKIFCLCMKGIEENTGKRLSEIMIDCGVDASKVAVWVGPGHIQSFTLGYPSCMVIDSSNKELVKYLADSFRSSLIRFYYGDDLIGNEIGAAAKNVIGIAAGMLDGGGYTTLKGPLMARGAREVSRLIKALGGNELSAYGLCHLGDYETTLFSEYSHNRKFGISFVKKEEFSKLAEGVSTSKALKFLAEKYNVDLPINNAVYSIINEGKDPMEALLYLFSRDIKKEF